MPSARPKIEIEHVDKYYRTTGAKSKRLSRRGRMHGTVQALRDANLVVAEGEFVSLIGPSGCGKTTLLKVLDGLVPYDSGQVSVSGKPVTGPGRDRAFVFQHFGLFPWRTVMGNVTLPLEAAGKSRSERENIAWKYIRMVGLESFANHHPHELSGGMQQRVGIARALAVDPEILLMDEPFGALDAQTRELMQIELLGIWEKTRKTVVFVTHSVDEAIFLSGRVAVMSAHPGTVSEVIDVPFPYPRTEGDLKRDPLFADMRYDIWNKLLPSKTATA